MWIKSGNKIEEMKRYRNNVFISRSLSELVSVQLPRLWAELKFIYGRLKPAMLCSGANQPPPTSSQSFPSDNHRAPINYIPHFLSLCLRSLITSQIGKAPNETAPPLTRNSFGYRFGHRAPFTTEEWFRTKRLTSHLLSLCSLTRNTSGSQRPFKGRGLQ